MKSKGEHMSNEIDTTFPNISLDKEIPADTNVYYIPMRIFKQMTKEDRIELYRICLQIYKGKVFIVDDNYNNKYELTEQGELI